MKTITKSIRVTKKENELIEKRLKNTNLSFTDYAKKCLLNRKIVIKNYDDLFINKISRYLEFSNNTFFWGVLSGAGAILSILFIIMFLNIYKLNGSYYWQIDKNNLFQSNIKGKMLVRVYK